MRRALEKIADYAIGGCLGAFASGAIIVATIWIRNR